MAQALVALANITLGSTATTVTFSSIPGTYRDLRLVASVGGVNNDVLAQFNTDTSTSNYSRVFMTGQGTSTAGAGSDTSNGFIAFGYVGSLATVTLDVLDYSATDKHKTTLSRGADTAVVMAIAGRWASTAAITSMKIYPAGGNPFAAGSTFALYGVVA